MFLHDSVTLISKLMMMMMIIIIIIIIIIIMYVSVGLYLLLVPMQLFSSL